VANCWIGGILQGCKRISGILKKDYYLAAANNSPDQDISSSSNDPVKSEGRCGSSNNWPAQVTDRRHPRLSLQSRNLPPLFFPYYYVPPANQSHMPFSPRATNCLVYVLLLLYKGEKKMINKKMINKFPFLLL
jgi:hypothetical protein